MKWLVLRIFVAVFGYDPLVRERRLKSERDSAFNAAAGKLTGQDRVVFMLLEPGDVIEKGDWYVSSLGGQFLRAAEYYEHEKSVGQTVDAKSYLMPFFRPLKMIDGTTHPDCLDWRLGKPRWKKRTLDGQVFM